MTRAERQRQLVLNIGIPELQRATHGPRSSLAGSLAAPKHADLCCPSASNFDPWRPGKGVKFFGPYDLPRDRIQGSDRLFGWRRRWQLTAVLALPVAIQEGGQLIGDLGVVCRDVRRFGDVCAQIIELLFKLTGPQFHGTGPCIGMVITFDPLPLTAANGEVAVRAVQDHVRPDR